MTRQNYYQQRVLRQRQAVDEALVVALIGRERALQPRLGGTEALSLVVRGTGVGGCDIGSGSVLRSNEKPRPADPEIPAYCGPDDEQLAWFRGVP